MLINPWLSGAILALSLTNTILLFWLGLTVLLNTDRRNLGLYLAGGALLLGGLFFLSHSAIVSLGSTLRLQELELWWRTGWIPVTCLPFAWYSVMLWYGGYWEPESPLRPRHRRWFWITLCLAGMSVLLLSFAHALPSAAQLLDLDLTATPSISGVPLLVLIYPLYAVVCTGLSLDVLRWPAPTSRSMAEQARQRAWPWLGAASLGLFVVSLLVGGSLFWLVSSARQISLQPPMLNAIALLDLLISSLISFSILLVGQAIVSYEVFTGKSLPRRGLQHYWRQAVLWAVIYSLAASSAATVGLPVIYILLLTTVLLSVFYALMGWRSFEERQHLMESLRPFLASHDLYQELLLSQSASEKDLQDELNSTCQAAFQALCTDVLETSLAYLVPLGNLAPLAGPALTFPVISPQPALKLDLRGLELEKAPGWLAVDPQLHGGAKLAIPLLGRGYTSGVLLLGDKKGGGLYTQEEVDVARLAGESLLDRQASAELARRLMSLQRQHLQASQVLDHQARRALHDDILPQLHESILLLSAQSGAEDSQKALLALSEMHARIASLLRQLPPAANPEITRLGLSAALRVLVGEEFRSHFDGVDVQIDVPAAQQMDRLPALPAQVLYYAVREAVRNAARYGRGVTLDRALHLSLRAQAEAEGLLISVEDDGAGLAHLHEHDRNGGAGHGLALHSTLLAVLGGTLSVENLSPAGPFVTKDRGPGTRVLIRLPLESIVQAS
jgi:two-component sensor histidine kinase